MPLNKLNVLVAEDSKTFAAMLSDILKKEGYDVTTAQDGAQALEILNDRNKRYNLLMLDLQMPNMDGIELLEKFKREQNGNLPPTLILTATAPDSTLLLKLRGLGAKGYIVKSQSPGEIIYRIKGIASMGENRRRDMRELISIPIQYSSGNANLSVKSFDFTRNGLYIATTNPLPVGNVINIKYAVPSAKKQFTTRGKIVFNIKYDTVQKGTYPPGMGANFLDLTLEDLDVIDKYLEFLHQKKS